MQPVENLSLTWLQLANNRKQICMKQIYLNHLKPSCILILHENFNKVLVQLFFCLTFRLQGTYWFILISVKLSQFLTSNLCLLQVFNFLLPMRNTKYLHATTHFTGLSYLPIIPPIFSLGEHQQKSFVTLTRFFINFLPRYLGLNFLLKNENNLFQMKLNEVLKSCKNWCLLI